MVLQLVVCVAVRDFTFTDWFYLGGLAKCRHFRRACTVDAGSLSPKPAVVGGKWRRVSKRFIFGDPPQRRISVAGLSLVCREDKPRGNANRDGRGCGDLCVVKDS